MYTSKQQQSLISLLIQDRIQKAHQNTSSSRSFLFCLQSAIELLLVMDFVKASHVLMMLSMLSPLVASSRPESYLSYMIAFILGTNFSK